MIIVYDLELYNINRARPYWVSLYRVIKIADRYNRDLTFLGNQKCKIDTIVFGEEKCNNKMLQNVLSFKREARKLKTKLLNKKRKC